LLDGAETALTYRANTGLIIAYGAAELLSAALSAKARSP
jgi:hypothetical protein